MKEIAEEIKPLSEYENAVIIFKDNLGPSSGKYIDQFFTRGRRIILDFYYLSQCYFDIPKRTIRNKRNSSKKLILFNRTLEDIKNIHRDVGGYDMSYNELKELCRNFLEDDFNCLFIDRSKKRNQGRQCLCNESKNTYIEFTPETKAFWLT